MRLSERLRAVLPLAYRLHGWRRARAVERLIASEQAFYEGLAPPAMPFIPLERRLSARWRLKGLKPIDLGAGMKPHIFYATRPSNWEPHNLPPQLAAIGKLETYYYRERGFDDSAANWLAVRHHLDQDLLAFLSEVHSRNPIHLFLSYLSGWQIAPEIIHAIGQLGIPTCAYHWDDKLSFRGSIAGGRWTGPAAVAAAYDLNLTNARSSILKYEAEGGLALFWPEAANPKHFRPLDMPFEYDVSFVGACYGYRPVLVNYLIRKGIKIAAFGPGWPNGQLHEDQMVALYSKSRINLGFGGIGYSMRAQCLKGRDFEVPMSGALYLTSDNPELKLVFDVGSEIMTYLNREDCLRKIKHLLAHPDECEKIRNAARMRALRSHTWERRITELIALFSSAGIYKA